MNERESLRNATAGRHSVRHGLLLVDDDPLIVDSLSFVLKESYEVYAASNRNEVRALLQTLPVVPSLALVDLGLPPFPHQPDEGFALISELLAFNPVMKILVLSGQSKRTNIQHALTLGAVDFVAKPCDALLLKSRLQHQLMMLDAEQNESAAAEQGGLLGNSAPIETLRSLIRQFADTPFPVLIEGESGSGKELVAQSLHAQSRRAPQPFLTVNCAAFTPQLLEAQLCGHAKGAYTGADSARPGFFEEAGSGTLFLDEVGELPAELQSKLLRVLENGEYYRLGETQPRYSQARIVAATNRDLRLAVREGTFRQDLYHRLGVLTIYVPPLRERNGDWLLLLNHFRELYARSVPPFTLEPDAERMLGEYAFPGNVRELRNIAIRLGAKYPGKRVAARQLEGELEEQVPQPLGEAPVAPDDALLEQQLAGSGFRLDETLSAWEQRYINAALKMSGGNLSKAARLLGINRTTLYGKIQRFSEGGR